MQAARRLYERFSQLIHEAAKFGVVGFVAFVVNLVLSDWMHFGLGMGPVSAAIAGAAVATVVSYVGNRNWSFRHREHGRVGRETVIFIVLNAIGIVIQAATVYAFKEASHITGGLYYTSANAFGLALGTAFRFWSYRKWVWQQGQLASEDREQQASERHEVVEPVLVSSPEADRR